MTPAEINGYIEGFIEFDRRRAEQRWTTALKYLGVTALLLAGTGTVTLIADHQQEAARPSGKLIVDLAQCPELTEKSEPIVSFTITMRGDGTPEVQGCNRWHARMKYQPRGQK